MLKRNNIKIPKPIFRVKKIKIPKKGLTCWHDFIPDNVKTDKNNRVTALFNKATNKWASMNPKKEIIWNPVTNEIVHFTKEEK